MNIKLYDELLKIAAYSEGLDIDTERNVIVINFRSKNGMHEIMDFMKNGIGRVIGEINNVSVTSVEISYDFSKEVDEDGIPVSSKCIIKYEIGEVKNLIKF
jgi:hypothetical protein